MDKTDICFCSVKKIVKVFRIKTQTGQSAMFFCVLEKRERFLVEETQTVLPSKKTILDKKASSAEHLLEWVADSKVEGKVAAKARMNDRIKIAPTLVNRIDGLHTTIEAEDEEA